MKISAMVFSLAGDKYLGRSYQEMDCQAFVEKCMADVGYRRDLGGSNSWYRECRLHGWVGSPEECAKEFGSVPKGALLFILEPVGPKTPAKFRDDGVGDATHMGIVTGRGDGAIHSSKSRGGVVTSKFKGKTIPNGGWNRVGLLPEFDYGDKVNSEFRIQDSELSAAAGKEESLKMPESRYVAGPNNETVNLRKKPDGALIDRIRSGETAEILTEGPVWSKVRIGSRVGWMMTRFLAEELTSMNNEELKMNNDTEEELIDLLTEVYEALRELCERIEDVIAKG